MRFSSLPTIILFFASIFSRKNRENHGFWPPKTLPKPSQNPFKIDVPKNIRFFIEFCSKYALLQQRRHRFRIGFSNTFACRALFFESLFECILGPKNLPKTSPKRCPNPLKIDVENVLFFNIDFWGFRPRFWSLLGLQLGAKLAPNCVILFGGRSFFTCLS